MPLRYSTTTAVTVVGWLMMTTTLNTRVSAFVGSSSSFVVRDPTTWTSINEPNLSQLFVGASDFPELDLDLNDIPPAADFVDPIELPVIRSSTTASQAPQRRPQQQQQQEQRQQPSNNQAENGQAKDMPNTYVRCGSCNSLFAVKPDDLGERGKGRRLECCVCGNTWFQSKDRIMTVRPGMELVTLPQLELDRLALNKAEGKPLNFVGDAKLYVGNLAFECSEEMIHEEFSKLGSVGEISMVYDNESGRPRGFAFVTMRTQEDAKKVMEALNGFSMMGRELSIREANN